MGKKNDIESRINQLSQYFTGIELRGGLWIVRVLLPAKWQTYNSEDGLIKVAKSTDTANEWYYYAQSTDCTIDAIFDLIEETVNLNESINKKIELMRVKMEELKGLFQSESLERLETLQFVFGQPVKAKRKYVRKQPKVSPSEEINDVKQED